MATSTFTSVWARSRFLAGAVAFALLAATVPVSAQTDDIDVAKRAREEARAEAAEVAAGLDPLLAADAELEAAVEALELHVATQLANLASVQQSLAASRSVAEVAADRVLDMELEIGALRAALQAQAVEAYVTTDSQRVDSLFNSSDITVAAHKRALLNTISSSGADLIDRLRSAEQELDDLLGEAEAAVVRVEDEEAAEQDQLQVLESALADEQRLKDALDVRIADVQAEIDGLEAQEDELTRLITGLIAEEEARKAAEEAAIRRAEEQRRLALEAERLAEQRQDQPPVPTPAPLPPPQNVGQLVWPVSGVITSFYGPRWGRMHNGIDVSAPTGSPVYAAQGGTVVQASVYGGYGNMIVVDHGGGFTTVYAHLSDYKVSAGQSVSRGARIGSVGCTGSCTGPHLHFEARVNGSPQDPLSYL